MKNSKQHSLFDQNETTTAPLPKKVVSEKIKELIKDKTKLSLFLSPYSQVTSSLDELPEYTPTPTYLSAQIKIIQYGTGTGKSYGAIKQWLLVQSMDYSDEHKAAHGVLLRDQSRGNFTNCIFVTPHKNQMNFDKKLTEEMLALGITPLSVLGVRDTYSAKNKLWINGEYSTLDRLNDLCKVEGLIRSTHSDVIKGWEGHHISTLSRLLKTIRDAVVNIELLEFKKSDLSNDEYEEQEKALTSIHNKSVQQLILSCLNNVYNKADAIKSGALNTYAESDDVDSDNEYQYADSDENNNESNAPVSGMYPIEEDEVFDTIFAPAKDKTHFDALLLGDGVLSAEDSYECMLASLKKEILRVYAPLNYAMHLPSFICMTSDKLRVRPTLFRKSSKPSQNHWVNGSGDYTNFSELVGDKYSFNEAVIAIPSTTPDAKTEQVERLKNTMMQRRSSVGLNEGKDPRSGFSKNNINFYVILDESNELFNKAFLGSDTHDGVVKSILDQFSVTDILSCVERKYREFSTQAPNAIDCYEQNKFFFESMYAYLDRYCEIDPKKVFDVPGRENDQTSYLMQFGLPPNILYIDNGEAQSITKMVKNAFSVTSKKFIDKERLQSIYICKRGEHRYLSVNKTDDSDMTLYDLYQIIISVLFAAIMVESDTKEGGRFTQNQREAFRVDLGGGRKGHDVRRQNEPLAALLVYAKNNAARYRRWLTSDHLNNHGDAIIDDWFAYIQTKLLFSLNLNRDFAASPDVGHQTKTFINIKLHLITHHPEIDILKMAHDTNNFIHIMSATSGKEHAYSGQYNIKFLKTWGKDLGIKVSTPEYDHAYDIDYREAFGKFRERREDMRDIEVATFDSVEEAKKLYSFKPAPKKMIIGMNKPAIAARNIAEEHLYSVNNSLEHPEFMPNGSYNDKAFKIAIAGLLRAFSRMESTLLISYKKSLTVLLLESMRAEFLDSGHNISTLNNAVRNHQTSVTFIHNKFGRFQLPLLNEWLTESSRSKSLAKPNMKRIKDDIRARCIYLADFMDMADILEMPASKIVRLALFDSRIDKLMSNYRDYFIAKEMKVKGEMRQLHTTIVSYTQAAALGLNNVIDNQILPADEDVNTLFLPSLAFWSEISAQKKSDKQDGLDGWQKIENTLVYMRYLADVSQYNPMVITDFDSNIGSNEALELLKAEHNIQKSNIFKQTLGRTERKDSEYSFKSSVYLPLEDLKEQAKINFIAYKLDKNLVAHRDKTDFCFMSMNNYRVLQAGAKAILGSSTTDKKRGDLERSTQATKDKLDYFTSGTGFMGKLLRAARSGDESDDARRLADAAMEFDRAYREHTILTWPQKWLEGLKDQELIQDHSLLSKLGWVGVSEYLDDVFVDLSTFQDGESLDVYQHVKGNRRLGLTDFFGSHGDTIQVYNPSKIVLPRIDFEKIPLGDERFNKLATINNKLIDTNSDFYKKPFSKNVVLHPAMLHMAIGNVGERLFQGFLDCYQGAWVQYSNDEMVARLGYQFYELFDCWLYNCETRQFVCVDVKNISLKDNIHQAERLVNSGDNKTSKLKMSMEVFKTGSDSEIAQSVEGMINLFKDSNEIDIVFINVRHDQNSNEMLIKKVITVGGRVLTVNVHYLCLFQTVGFIPVNKRVLIPQGRNRDGTPKKVLGRTSKLTVNSRLLDILGIGKMSDIERVFDNPKQHDEFDITNSSKVLFPHLAKVDEAADPTYSNQIK